MATKVQPRPAETAAAKTVMVEYINAYHFETRTLTVKDFAKVGIEAPRDFTWDVSNGFRVPKEALMEFLDEAQYAASILADARFEEVEV